MVERRNWSWPACALLLTACAGVSPRPDQASAANLPVVELSPAERERLARLVDVCMESIVLRRYPEAEQASVDALDLDPRCARARAVHGMILLEAARRADPPDLFLTNEAETEVELAVQLAPADPFVGWIQALFLAESGHLSAAAAAAEAALERCRDADPRERAPLFGLAGTYRYEFGEEYAALPLIEAYLAIRPDDAAAHFRRGDCLLRMAMLPTGVPQEKFEIAQGQAVRAAAAFRRSCELAPGDEDVAIAVATALVRAAELAGRRDLPEERSALLTEARAHLGEVSERFPQSAEVRFRIGVVEEERDQRADAITAYEAGLRRDAGHLGCLLNLAAVQDENDPAAAGLAADLLRRALEVDRSRGGLEPRERRRIEQFLAR